MPQPWMEPDALHRDRPAAQGVSAGIRPAREEIAARLGVSRAALYRYEKGEVIKLDTIQRLAELLKISPLSLLGIGVEYYNRPIGYFERIRQIEETSEQMLQVVGPLCYLTTSDVYERRSRRRSTRRRTRRQRPGAAAGDDRAGARHSDCTQEDVCAAPPDHHRDHLRRRGRAVAGQGVAGSLPVSDRLRRICRQVAATEIENIASIMDTEPMGLQFGLAGRSRAELRVQGAARPRSREPRDQPVPDRHAPERPDRRRHDNASDEAIAAHQRVAEANWRESIKGPTAAARFASFSGPWRPDFGPAAGMGGGPGPGL